MNAKGTGKTVEVTSQPSSPAGSSPVVARPRQRRTVRTVSMLTVIAVVALVVCAWVTDSFIAARTESRIAHELQRYSNLPVQPAVTAGGFPFLYEAERGKLSSLTVDAQDLDVPGFGLVTVHSSATNIEASQQDIIHGQIENAPVETISTTLSLDGLALGERLGITDLTIRRLANTAPNGGQESSAVFSGSIGGMDVPATVAVSLRIKADIISMDAYEVLDGPASRDKNAPVVKGSDIPHTLKEQIKKAFSLQLEGKYLPLRARPDFIYCEGGSIFLQSSQQNVTINLSDLAPMAKEEPGQAKYEKDQK
ncbi:DUF2993 domain-containing protein [Corynebacterium sp. PCR 32]|uniref:LmeA family phospholipid-binding protein n=1 Tax=Corynebacterium sp. PCR 32 TaxID=3351342 RepID=UPI003751459B